MVKVFVSEGTRRDAHNLDDLIERWEYRAEADAEAQVVAANNLTKLPHFQDTEDAYQFRALLGERRVEVETQLSNTRNKAQRQPLIIMLHKISNIQSQLKNYIHLEQNRQWESDGRHQKICRLETELIYKSLEITYLKFGIQGMEKAYEALSIDDRNRIQMDELKMRIKQHLTEIFGAINP